MNLKEPAAVFCGVWGQVMVMVVVVVVVMVMVVVMMRVGCVCERETNATMSLICNSHRFLLGITGIECRYRLYFFLL